MWRGIVSALLAVIAGIMICAGAVANWASTTVVSTSGFTAAVGPLSAHPEVQQELTSAVSSRVITSLTDAVASAPFPLSLLQGVIPQLTGPINEAVGKAVTSDAAAQAWTTTVTTIHDDAVAAARGQESGIALGEGNATIDLNTIRDPLLASVDVPDQVKSLLGQVNLGEITITTGISPTLLEWGVRLSERWRLLIALGLVAIVAAALVARRAGAGLLMAGVAIVVTSGIASVIIGNGLRGTPPPDALSRALSNVFVDALQPPLTQSLTLAALSGVVLAVVGGGVWLVAHLRGRRSPEPVPAQ